MAPTLVLVHTIPGLVADFAARCREDLPEVRVLHVLDEPMLERIKQRGHGAPEDAERLANHVATAQAIGALAVLVTCSTVSRSVIRVRDRFTIPVIAIDEPMAVEAVRRGPRIAVIATAATTLEASGSLLQETANREGIPVQVSLRLVDGALESLLAGDGAAHDRLVERAVREAAARADVVVLAQATMARVLDTMKGRPTDVPVLDSPRLAIRAVRRALNDRYDGSRRAGPG